MKPELESDTGGLRERLHSLALKASAEGTWSKKTPQLAILERTVILPNMDDTTLTATFEASRKPLLGSAKRGFRTSYALRALEVQDGLTYTELPLEAQSNVVLPSSVAESTEISYASDGDEDSTEIEQMVDGDIDYDDMYFRFERGVEYTLDNKARFVGVRRSARYYQIEDDDLTEICEGVDFTTGNPSKNNEVAESMRSWPNAIGRGKPTGLGFPNADLQSLEYRIDKRSLGDDLRFLDLVGNYSQSPEAIEAVRREQIQAVLAILAFTTLSGSVDEVQRLI